MPVKCLNGYLYSIVVSEKAHEKLEVMASEMGKSPEDVLEMILTEYGKGE